MNAKDFFGGLAVLTLGVGLAGAQEATPVAPPPSATPGPTQQASGPSSAPSAVDIVGLATGPATVAPHWSKNSYPTEIPEGATYYIVVRNDTLWDIAKRFLGSPYLWPQVWDQNKYIADAHWIYPGDPVVLPKLALVADSAGGRGAGIEGMPDEGDGAFGAEGIEGTRTGAATEVLLMALTEESTLQCAEYIASPGDDTSFRVITSEEGEGKIAFATRDVLYLNRGSSAGVKAGDRFMVHREDGPVVHPRTQRSLGVKVLSPGWVEVVLVRENSSVAVVEEACSFIQADDYLLPFERVNVPLVVPRDPATRLTPPSGKITRQIVEIAGQAISAGTGQLVHVDAGSRDGVTPGSLFVAYRIVEPGIPTPRRVIGELAVISVRETTCVAKVVSGKDSLSVGDEVELR